ncbi:hypothetical protein Salmuc_02003 [Salipiger mucosus DSM 16094]|uniref:Uncharacterized protein n=1 Tax=Salipiger mucosus DSM 16094 TaxID=1123237 RepID=S9RQD9_9RHOB|nr:hypothetical protein Salmuc_02003 [Salipiger mucosus DSM 16094]
MVAGGGLRELSAPWRGRIAYLEQEEDPGTAPLFFLFSNTPAGGPHLPLEHRKTSAYLSDVPQGTMGINAHEISGSDPGAVPGGSTINPSLGGSWGRNRIDERVKMWLCPGEIPPLSVH